MNRPISLFILFFFCILFISCEPWNLEKKTFPTCDAPSAKITTNISKLTVNINLVPLTGPITKIIWNFGDGNSSDKIESFAYTYKNPGRYTIRVSIFNACNDTQQYSFDVLVFALPVAITSDETLSEANSLLLEMRVEDNGNSLITKYGLCLSANSATPTLENSTVRFSNNNPLLNSPYSFRFINLQPNTIYYYRAFAQNAFGIAYGPVKKANTMPIYIDKGNTLLLSPNVEGRINPISFVIGKKLYTGMGTDSQGNIYNDFWEYNTQKNKWEQKAAIPAEARYSAVSFAINDKGYVGLGRNNNKMLNDFWEYSPTSNSWTRKADFPSSARHSAFSISHAGYGYVGGGTSSFTFQNDFWQYDPINNSWQRKVDFPLYKVNGSGFSIGRNLYIGFGQNMSSATNGFGQNAFDFWLYNISTNTWERKTDIPSDITLDTKINFTINGKGYIGRFDKDYPTLMKMYFYTPETNKWDVNNGFLAIPRYFACSGVVDNVGYYGFGQSNNGALKDFWLFKP